VSYDLFFATRDNHALITETDFISYFSNRNNYKISGSDAGYFNEDTGVYFSFSYEEEYIATFNINYWRPGFFALEAASEIEPFVSYFDLIVDDPQRDGMGRGDFSREAFIAGWTKSNKWACSIFKERSEQVFLYPGDILKRYWQWNFERKELQRYFGESIFVPKISFAAMADGVKSYAVWGDAYPIIIPRVDALFLVRETLTRRQWFKKKRETTFVEWREIEELLSRYSVAHSDIKCPIEYYLLDYDTPPSAITRFLRAKPALDNKIQGLAPDQIIDAEFLNE
jgi:hypothetical protein